MNKIFYTISINKWLRQNFEYPKNMHESCSDTSEAIVNKHAPLKEKIVRENNAPFITKGL